MLKRLFSHSIPSQLLLPKPLTGIQTTPLRPFTTTTIRKMPLITSTGKPRIILGTM